MEMSLAKTYDIILMDVNMPRMDGLQATAQYYILKTKVNIRIRIREKELGIPRSYICGNIYVHLKFTNSNDGKWFEGSGLHLTLAMTEDRQRCYEGVLTLHEANG